MTHHPHVHMIVPGGGISFDRSQWIAKRPDFFLPVRWFVYAKRARARRVRSGYTRYAVPVLWLGHAHHRGVQGRRTPAPQADCKVARHAIVSIVSADALNSRS
jgi:hypothetical protein